MPRPNWLSYLLGDGLLLPDIIDERRGEKLNRGSAKVIVGQFFEFLTSEMFGGELYDLSLDDVHPDVTVWGGASCNGSYRDLLIEVKASQSGGGYFTVDHSQLKFYSDLTDDLFPYTMPRILYTFYVYRRVSIVRELKTEAALLDYLCGNIEACYIMPIRLLEYLIDTELQLYEYSPAWSAGRSRSDNHRFYARITGKLVRGIAHNVAPVIMIPECDGLSHIRPFNCYFIPGDRRAAWGRSWSFVVSHRGKDINFSKIFRYVPMLADAHNRIMHTQIECQDFSKIFRTYDAKGTLFYVDPPYTHGTRNTSSVYAYEMTDDDHSTLVNLMLNAKGMVIVSGYRGGSYERLDAAGWMRGDIKTVSMASARTKRSGIKGVGASTRRAHRVESIWINPEVERRLKDGKGKKTKAKRRISRR